jgi:hypothetical protein
MSKDGKKIDAFRIESEHAELRWVSEKLGFILIVMGQKFEGENASELKTRARLFVKGFELLIWEPVILVETRPDDGLKLSFSRAFHSKLKREDVYRGWYLPSEKEEEREWGMYCSPTTGDILEGTPGELQRPPREDFRRLSFTPERWKTLLALNTALNTALVTAADKLEKIFREGDVDLFLGSVLKDGLPALTFKDEKGKELKL